MYGTSGIMFSGGGNAGLIHLGIIKVLLYNKCMPKVVCGASSGSLIASFLGIYT